MNDFIFVEASQYTEFDNHFLSQINEFRNDAETYQYLNVQNFSPETIDQSKKWLYYKIRKSDRLYFLIHQETSCAGFINLMPHDLGSGIHYGLEIGIVIFRKYRRMGLARKAIDHVCQEVLSLNCRFLIARVLSSNSTSVSLFKSSGFQLVASFPNVVIDGSNLLFFHRECHL